MKKTLAAFSAFPLHFLLLQVPALSAEIISDFFLPEGDWKIPFAIALVFPYLCVTSTVSNCLTFATVTCLEEGSPVSFSKSWAMLRGKITSLVPVSLITGIVMVLGLLTVFVMLFHYLALYLFVPHLIVTEPKLPWSVYLLRSKKLVAGVYFRATLLVLLILFSSFWADGVAYSIEVLFSMGTNPEARIFLQIVKYIISLLTSAILSIGVCYFFLSRRKACEHGT